MNTIEKAMTKRTNLSLIVNHDNGHAYIKCDTGGDINDPKCQDQICLDIEAASKGKYKNVTINNWVVL